MRLQYTFDLTLILDSDRFNELLNRVYSKSEYGGSEKLVDQSLVFKGILVTYHDKQYKKKVRLTVNMNLLLDGDEPDEDNSDKLIRKLEKRIDSYFGSMLQLDDFYVSKVCLVTDINVGCRDNVTDYIRVLQRIGKVKFFSPSCDDKISEEISFCLDGNSNGLAFRIYDLEAWFNEQTNDEDTESKEQNTQAKKSVGLLRTEVRLMKSNAIRTFTDRLVASDQITDFCGKGRKIFLDVLQWVIPFGAFFKKDKAVEIIIKKVTDTKIRRRMLQLVALVSEKKSLLLAQKALSYRRIDEVMEEFRDIEVSPITISRRHDVKQLDNLYKYM